MPLFGSPFASSGGRGPQQGAYAGATPQGLSLSLSPPHGFGRETGFADMGRGGVDLDDERVLERRYVLQVRHIACLLPARTTSHTTCLAFSVFATPADKLTPPLQDS